MNRNLLIIVLIGITDIVIGQPNKSLSNKTDNILIQEIDTILERNSPANLDLNKHQLFLDTTRSYSYYDRIKEWRPLLKPPQGIIDYVSDIAKGREVTKVDLKEFPRLWVTVRKYNGQFVLYDRCDGSDPAYGLTDSTLNIYGPLEFDVDLISKLIMISDNEIRLELGSIKEKSKSSKAKFSISKTATKDIYLLEYQGGYYDIKSYVTPIEKIRNFDLIVNHCPINKTREFLDRFDEIEE